MKQLLMDFIRKLIYIVKIISFSLFRLHQWRILAIEVVETDVCVCGNYFDNMQMGLNLPFGQGFQELKLLSLAI